MRPRHRAGGDGDRADEAAEDQREVLRPAEAVGDRGERLDEDRKDERSDVPAANEAMAAVAIATPARPWRAIW